MVRHRRRFFTTASGAIAVAAAAGISNAPNVIAQPKVQWRMSTAWPPGLDVMQGSAQRLAKVVDETSGGRFRIEVFPGGQIMPPFDCFDATSQGTIQAFMATAYYWPEKEPALEWFTTVPFGMNPEGMAAWYYQGDGLKLLEEAHAAFNLVGAPRPGVRPADGRVVPEKDQHHRRLQGAQDAHWHWPRRQGLCQSGRHGGAHPGRRDLRRARASVIDASEWVGPHDDMQLGLHQAARYYYYPGWHEPGTTTEFGFKKNAYDALPVDLRRTLDHAAAAVQVYGLTDYHVKNAIAREGLKTEFKGKVELLQLPVPVLRDLKKLAAEVVKEESEKSPMARTVHASFTKFQALVGPWDHVAEGAYHQFVAG
jgi:TRAP-type mannitol/chloroaromatic compound transport system substrate-binding protein